MKFSFYAARVNFIEVIDILKFKYMEKDRWFDLLGNIIMKYPKYLPLDKRSKFILLFGDFIQDNKGNLIAFKLGRESKHKRPEYNEAQRKFIEIEEKEHPNLWVFLVKEQNAIIFEKKTSVFRDYNSLLHLFERFFNEHLYEYALEVKLSFISEKSEFWKVIRDLKEINYVSFQLYPPNFFGDTDKELSEILKENKEKYNTDSIGLSLYNNTGSLKIDEEDKKIKHLTNWIANGGGKWDVRGKDINGNKIHINNEKRPKELKVSLDIKIESNDVNSAKEIIRILSREIVPENFNED